MGTPRLRTTAAITLAAFVAGSLAPSASAASGEEVTSPAAAAGTPGQYIVLMKDDPVATYEGGIGGLPRTKPDQGNTLNARSGASKEYIDYLKAEQDALAEKVGATPDSQYQVTVNGFSAALSGEQVDTLRASKDVLGVFPDEIRHPDEQSSTEYLGLGATRPARAASGTRSGAPARRARASWWASSTPGSPRRTPRSPATR